MTHPTKENERGSLSLRLPGEPAFLPVATAFVEKGADALGLGPKEAMGLTLAMEEIFSYLCKITPNGQTVEVRCAGKGYYVRVGLLFIADELNIRAFNMTSRVRIDDESSLEEMGLLIAARFVDRLTVEYNEGGRYQLILIKEKVYPEPDDGPVPAPGPLENVEIRVPNPEELKLLSRLIRARSGRLSFPRALSYPGKIVDMIGGGEYRAAFAFDSAGHIGGGILWHWLGRKTVECFGPYLFNQTAGSTLSGALIEYCLGDIAKTPAIGLVNRYPTSELPEDYFEHLGDLLVYGERGASTRVPAYYRQMHEDPGSHVWAHGDLEDYLKGVYERLAFPREIRLVKNEGEGNSAFSVLSVDFDKSQGTVTLHPVQSGGDILENLQNHIRLLRVESYRSVFFEMDLGIPWHSDFTPALFKEHFVPRLILPYAGKGDTVVFQREEPAP